MKPILIDLGSFAGTTSVKENALTRIQDWLARQGVDMMDPMWWENADHVVIQMDERCAYPASEDGVSDESHTVDLQDVALQLLGAIHQEGDDAVWSALAEAAEPAIRGGRNRAQVVRHHSYSISEITFQLEGPVGGFDQWTCREVGSVSVYWIPHDHRGEMMEDHPPPSSDVVDELESICFDRGFQGRS